MGLYCSLNILISWRILEGQRAQTSLWPAIGWRWPKIPFTLDMDGAPQCEMRSTPLLTDSEIHTIHFKSCNPY